MTVVTLSSTASRNAALHAFFYDKCSAFSARTFWGIRSEKLRQMRGIPSVVGGVDQQSGTQVSGCCLRPTGYFASGYFIGDEWLATHRHFPFGILTQVSVHRSRASTGFPLLVPFPTQMPVATAVLPYTSTFTSLISLVSHFPVLIVANACARLCTELSASVSMKASASSGATPSAFPFFACSVHLFSSAITALATAASLLLAVCSTAVSPWPEVCPLSFVLAGGFPPWPKAGSAQAPRTKTPKVKMEIVKRLGRFMVFSCPRSFRHGRRHWYCGPSVRRDLLECVPEIGPPNDANPSLNHKLVSAILPCAAVRLADYKHELWPSDIFSGRF